MHGFQWDAFLQMCIKVPIIDHIERPIVTTARAKSSLAHASTTNSPRAKVHTTDPTTDQSIVKTTERKKLGNKTLDAHFPTSPSGREYYEIVTITTVSAVCISILLVIWSYKKRENIFKFICQYCSCRGISSSEQQRRDSEAMSPMQLEQQGQDLEEIIIAPSDRGRKDHVQFASGPKEEQDNLIQQPTDEVNEDPEEEEGQPKEDVEKMPCNHDLDGTRLSGISTDLQDRISVQISNKDLKGWEQIGEFCKVSKMKLEEIKTKSTWAEGSKLPGKFLLEFLQASQPDLTVKEFMKFLKYLNREDVISTIKKEYQCTV